MNPTSPFQTDFFSPLLDFSNDVNLFWNLVGVLVLVGFIIYSLFSVIIIRQVWMMASTFRTSASFILKIFSLVHFIFSLFLIVLAYTIVF